MVAAHARLRLNAGMIKSRLHYGREALKKHMMATQSETITGLGYEFT